MANTSGVTEVSGTAGVAVAERVAAAHSMWLSTLPTIRRAPMAELVPLAEPVTARMVTVAGAVAAGHGPISDMAVSRDGRSLVAAHYGADVVSIVDTATLCGHRHRHRCRRAVCGGRRRPRLRHHRLDRR